MSCSSTYDQIKAGTLAIADVSDTDILAMFGCIKETQKQEMLAILTRGGGVVSPYTNVEPAITLSSVTDSGTIGSGLFEVSIANVGIAAGTVGGAAFPIGASVTYRGYIDPVTSEVRTPADIAYDATGTTFLISTTVYTAA